MINRDISVDLTFGIHAVCCELKIAFGGGITCLNKLILPYLKKGICRCSPSPAPATQPATSKCFCVVKG